MHHTDSALGVRGGGCVWVGGGYQDLDIIAAVFCGKNLTFEDDPYFLN